MSQTVLTLITALAFTAAATAQSASWKIDPNHSTAQFAVRHLGVSTVRGAFTKVSGSAFYDPANPERDSIDVTIETSSVDTRVEMRDNDLRSARFLDAQKYPAITFRSKQVRAMGSGKLSITGDLTIKGVSKEVVLDVDGPSAAIKDPMGSGQRMGASATTKINRQDFGVSALPGVVGDEISITIDTELIQPQAK